MPCPYNNNMRSLKLKSSAKLNLYLRILDKRPDGYHNLVTLFERIDLCDEITISSRGKARRAPTIKITCSNLDVPLDSRNLAHKAASALMAETGIKRDVNIHIKKRIPIAGGLGGGSSNAATVLKGLNILWNLKLEQKELMAIGAKIGADVNFFLSGKSFAIGTSRGEVTSPLHLKKSIWHVLVVPEIGFSTKEIYALWDKMHKDGNFPPSQQGCNNSLLGTNFQHGNNGKISLTVALADVKILLHSIQQNNFALLGKNLHNDLEESAQIKDCTIVKIKELLKSYGIENLLMSGSGSTVFTVMFSRKEAIGLRHRLARLKNRWQIFIAKTY